MRWFKPGLRNSISALLGTEVRRTSPESLEPIRKAMMAALGSEGAMLNPELSRRLQYLPDANALWFARAEMVAVLSRMHGEAKAVNMVHALTPNFQGLLPKSLLESERPRR
jgi:hypothetical protein